MSAKSANSGQINCFPLGDNALTLSFGNEISRSLNDRAVGLSRYFEEQPFEGFIETVPAYSSVTVFYDVSRVRKAFPGFPTAFEAVRNLTETALANLAAGETSEPAPVAIPVKFGKEFALDLDFIAREKNLPAGEVVRIFTAGLYRVFMLGFMPGFAYMGEVDERIAVPRKRSPRLLVPRGSVGIAGFQTGIYPFDSPGGWQIVGHTDFGLFTPSARFPSALQTGDLVKFYAVEK